MLCDYLMTPLNNDLGLPRDHNIRRQNYGPGRLGYYCHEVSRINLVYKIKKKKFNFEFLSEYSKNVSKTIKSFDQEMKIITYFKIKSYQKMQNKIPSHSVVGT